MHKSYWLIAYEAEMHRQELLRVADEVRMLREAQPRPGLLRRALMVLQVARQGTPAVEAPPVHQRHVARTALGQKPLVREKPRTPTAAR